MREGRSGPRVRGRPTSANGASSLHLFWDLAGPLSSVSVDLTVMEAPTVQELYFWALQADFVDESGRSAGGAHLGLQWHPSFPGSTAVNWGGYGASGGELGGSESGLPSSTANPNTRDLEWDPTRPYRLTIGPAHRVGSLWAWPGAVTDVTSGAEGPRPRACSWRAGARGGRGGVDRAFARCDDPKVTVRWSSPSADRPDGTPATPARATVNYQTHADGGARTRTPGPRPAGCGRPRTRSD